MARFRAFRGAINRAMRFRALTGGILARERGADRLRLRAGCAGRDAVTVPGLR